MTISVDIYTPRHNSLLRYNVRVFQFKQGDLQEMHL